MTDQRPHIAVAPQEARFPHHRAVAAVEAGGGVVTDLHGAEALVWLNQDDSDALRRVLQQEPQIRWVQLPWAGVEHSRDVLDTKRLWTSGKGVYAEPVAELTLALLIAGFRGVGVYARARAWRPVAGRNLYGARVTVLGGGGITCALLRLLGPFNPDVTVVRRHPVPMAGARSVVGPDQLDAALDGADGVVVALALTPETTGIINRHRLELLSPHGWLVNVARGSHVVTDDLVAALRDGAIGGAGLDVTDPEPLPAGHPLWELPNCIITPHVANTIEMAQPLLVARIAENVRRWGAGQPVLGTVNVELGY